MTQIVELWRAFWALVGGALSLNGAALEGIRDDPLAYAAALLLAVAAGCSKSVGQSVVLFVNRVPPGRFAVAVLAGGLLFAARIAVWTASVWLIGVVAPRFALPAGTIGLVVCFGQAPQLFAFLEMIPYLGTSLRRALDAYSLVVVVAALQAVLDLRPLPALLAAALGWLLQAFLSGLLERPLAGVRGWMWRTVTGREGFVTAAEAERAAEAGAPA